MRLNSLEIDNFRVIRRARLRFSQKVIAVVGPNGAGKSSIIEAISWALYGNVAARTGRDEIRSTFADRDEGCRVCLDFRVGDIDYRVIRRLVGRQERAEAELHSGQTPIAVGVTETQKAVVTLVGLDWAGFKTSFLARQQELNALSDLQPSRRRDHLAGMLGIEKLDKAVARLRDDTRERIGKAEYIERRMADAGLLAKRIEELSARLGGLTGAAASAQTAKETAQRELAKSAELLREGESKRADSVRLEATIETERKAAAELRVRLEQLRNELKRLAEEEKELEGLKKRVADLDKVKQQIDQLRSARERHEARKNALDQVAEAQKEQSALRTSLADLESTIVESEKRLAAIPGDIEKLAEREEKSLEKARDEYSRLGARVGSVAADVEKMENQLASINDLGAESVCDRCLRPLGDDLDKIEQHLRQELNNLVSEREKDESELQRKKEEGTEINKRCSQYRDLVKEKYELETCLKSLLAEKAVQQKRSVEIAARLEKLKQQAKAFGEVVYDEREMARLTEQMAALEKDRSRLDELRGRLARLPETNKDAADLEGRIKATDDRLKTLLAEQESLGFSAQAYQKMQDEFASAQKDRDELVGQQAAAEKEEEVCRKELDEKLEQRIAFEKDAEELDATRESQFYGEKLTRLFGDYRKYLIARIRPTLADLSGNLIREMTADRYSMVDLDEEYNLSLMDNGQYFGVERFSGGEKDLANLCLRLAISQALTDAAGLSHSFIILDEVFGSQDRDRRELIVKSLGNLAHRFSQILLITHISEIRDRVEELIEVYPTGAGWSEVKGGSSGA